MQGWWSGVPGIDYPVDPNLCINLTTNSFLRSSSLSRKLHRYISSPAEAFS